MLDERKAAILRAVVEEYIDTAQPVGSAHVVRSSGRAGVVGHRAQRHGHPRAGGLPPPAPHQRRPGPHREGLPLLRRPPRRSRPTCDGADAVQVRSFFDAGPRRDRADAAGHQSRLLADLTELRRRRRRPAARREATVRSVQVVGLTPAVVLVVVVLSNGAVEKHTARARPSAARRRSTERIGAGHRAPRRPPHRVAPDRRSAVAARAPATPAADAVVRRCARGSLRRDSRRRRRPRLRRRHLADGVAPSTPSRRCARCSASSSSSTSSSPCCATCSTAACTVAIGTETGMAPLAECALVVAPYQVGGRAGRHDRRARARPAWTTRRRWPPSPW